MRSRLGRSVTSIRPSGRKARPQGWLSPRATVSTVRSPAVDGKFWAAAVDAAALSASMAAHKAFIEKPLARDPSANAKVSEKMRGAGGHRHGGQDDSNRKRERYRRDQRGHAAM